MKIGELAHATDTPIETIRYYEREGLLPAPGRSEANYRIYRDTHVQRLAFIRRCRVLDMSLDEVRILLRYIDAPEADCDGVNALLDAHIGHVELRLAELGRLQRELRQLRAFCKRGGPPDSCGILRTLRGEPPTAAGAKASPPRRRRAAGHVPGTLHARR